VPDSRLFRVVMVPPSLLIPIFPAEMVPNPRLLRVMMVPWL
jgi:hypothetical protein